MKPVTLQLRNVFEEIPSYLPMVCASIGSIVIDASFVIHDVLIPIQDRLELVIDFYSYLGDSNVSSR
jgi:hypothetical protein